MDYITGKLILVVVGLIVFGVWQLRDINRELKKSRSAKPAPATDADDDQATG